MKRILISNPRRAEYDEYLLTHINGVVRSWEEILRPAISERLADFNLSESDISAIDVQMENHDASKQESDEYNAYCNYFYPYKGFEKDQAAFDLAWLLHQHRNPHHHQFWVLIRDEGEKQPLDMPICYILEMLCDWHSFTLRDPESTAYKWWNEHRHEMVLSDNTIKIIEDLIDLLKEPLS